jgi:solute carrier family 45 protein 1/2/4
LSILKNLSCSSSSAAWIIFLFLGSRYVGELYKRSLPAATTYVQQTIINEEANRLGSRALFHSALVSLIYSLVLPVFVAEAAGHPSKNQHSSWWNRVCRVPRGVQVDLVTMWATGHLVFAGCMFAILCVTSLLSITLHSLLDASFTV